MRELLSSEVMVITLCIGCYLLGKWIYGRYRIAVLQPLLTATVFVVLFLLLTGIEYSAFKSGSRVIHFLLGPTVVSLGYVLYEQVKYIKGNVLSISISVLSGSVVSIMSVIMLCKLFGADVSVIHSITPKSVTTPIALSLCEKNGGIPSLTAITVAITGIFGAIIAPFIFKIGKITDPLAQGLALGTSAHAVGTAKALELGTLQGAIGGLAIGLMGFLTVLLLPIIESIFL